MPERTYVIRATWDDDARVWVAVSDDVPGLVAEAPKSRNFDPEIEGIDS